MTLKTFNVGDAAFSIRHETGFPEAYYVDRRDDDDCATVIAVMNPYNYPQDRGQAWRVIGDAGDTDRNLGTLDNNNLKGEWLLYEQPIRSIKSTGCTNLIDAIEIIAKRWISQHMPVVESEGGLTD